MNSRITYFLLSLLVTAGEAFSSGRGVLPRGEGSGPGKSKEPIDQEQEIFVETLSVVESVQNIDRTCDLTLAHLPAKLGFFGKDGQEYFHLAKKEKSTSSDEGVKQLYRFHLNRINLESFSTQLVALVDLPDVQAIGFHDGMTSKSFSAVSFAPMDRHCFRGKAELMTVAIANEGPVAGKKSPISPILVNTSANIVLVDSQDFPSIYNLDRQGMMQVDIGTKQVRYLPIKINDWEHLLYVDGKRSIHFVLFLHLPSGERALIRYDGLKPTKRLRFKASERLVFQGDQFAIAKITEGSNTIDMMVKKSWAQGDLAGTFPIKVPKEVDLSSVRVQMNFAKNLALLDESMKSASEGWRQVVLFQLQTGETLLHYKSLPSEHISQAFFNTKGNLLMMVIKDLATRLDKELKIYNIETKTWHSVLI